MFAAPLTSLILFCFAQTIRLQCFDFPLEVVFCGFDTWALEEPVCCGWKKLFWLSIIHLKQQIILRLDSTNNSHTYHIWKKNTKTQFKAEASNTSLSKFFFVGLIKELAFIHQTWNPFPASTHCQAKRCIQPISFLHTHQKSYWTILHFEYSLVVYSVGNYHKGSSSPNVYHTIRLEFYRRDGLSSVDSNTRRQPETPGRKTI